MKDKACLALMDTECERDYKKTHFWERRGIFKGEGDIYCVWQCTQCEICLIEFLEFMNKPKWKDVPLELCECKGLEPRSWDVENGKCINCSKLVKPEQDAPSDSEEIKKEINKDY